MGPYITNKSVQCCGHGLSPEEAVYWLAAELKWRGHERGTGADDDAILALVNYIALEAVDDDTPSGD